jgi:hypothetical protein
MTTIRNYLKSKKYFIGAFKSRRRDKCPSGYALTTLDDAATRHLEY